jgi:hypothetical protein
MSPGRAAAGWRREKNRIKTILANLGQDEAFFLIDEYGPFAIKDQPGRSLVAPGEQRLVQQWQRSRGSITLSAAIELSSNQVSQIWGSERVPQDFPNGRATVTGEGCERDAIIRRDATASAACHGGDRCVRRGTSARSANERTAALRIRPMDHPYGPHITIAVANHDLAPAVATNGHVPEECIHTAGALGDIFRVEAKQAKFRANSTGLTVPQTI